MVYWIIKVHSLFKDLVTQTGSVSSYNSLQCLLVITCIVFPIFHPHAQSCGCNQILLLAHGQVPSAEICLSPPVSTKLDA